MRTLGVHGVGMVTDACASVGAFAAALGNGAAVPDVGLVDEAAVGGFDLLTQLTVRAAHQAMGIAEARAEERVGMLFVSAWGTIDSTVAYLESMLESEGKYASPRHFSRSVYSSIPSLTAIHFKLHGPCETLAFPGEVVRGALEQAWRMVRRGRAERMLIVWADQAAEIARELAAKAVTGLGRREFARYDAGLGQGAVAVVVGAGNLTGGWRTIDLDTISDQFVPPVGAPFATDAAVAWLARLLRS